MAWIYRAGDPASDGLASTSHTIGMNASSGISLIQRSAHDDGSARPAGAPLARRPVQPKYTGSNTASPNRRAQPAGARSHHGRESGMSRGPATAPGRAGMSRTSVARSGTGRPSAQALAHRRLARSRPGSPGCAAGEHRGHPRHHEHDVEGLDPVVALHALAPAAGVGWRAILACRGEAAAGTPATHRRMARRNTVR